MRSRASHVVVVLALAALASALSPDALALHRRIKAIRRRGLQRRQASPSDTPAASVPFVVSDFVVCPQIAVAGDLLVYQISGLDEDDPDFQGGRGCASVAHAMH